MLIPAGRGQAGAVAEVQPLAWPRSQCPLLQLCLSPSPACVFLPQVPSAIPIKGCILLPFLPSPAQHPTVLGWGGAHPGAGSPFPSGILVPTHGITPGGWEPRSCASDRTAEAAGQRIRNVPESWAGGLRSPEPRGSAGLGKGEGAGPLPEPQPVPAPSDGEVALPLPALTRGFLRPRLCRDPRPAWLSPGTGTGGCQHRPAALCLSFPTAARLPRAGHPRIPAVPAGSSGAGTGPHPHPAGSRLQGPRGPRTQSRPLASSLGANTARSFAHSRVQQFSSRDRRRHWDPLGCRAQRDTGSPEGTEWWQQEQERVLGMGPESR